MPQVPNPANAEGEEVIAHIGLGEDVHPLNTPRMEQLICPWLTPSEATGIQTELSHPIFSARGLAQGA